MKSYKTTHGLAKAVQNELAKKGFKVSQTIKGRIVSSSSDGIRVEVRGSMVEVKILSKAIDRQDVLNALEVIGVSYYAQADSVGYQRIYVDLTVHIAN